MLKIEKPELAGLKFEAFLRARCIELLGLWEGRLTTNRISDWFGVSRQAVSTDIKRYNEEINPSALEHKPSVKAYVAQKNMRPTVTDGSFNEFLSMVRLFEPSSLPDVADSNSLFSSIDTEKFQVVHRAIAQKKTISIRYLSSTTPGSIQASVFPTHLFVAEARPWVRLFDINLGQYRSLSFSQVQTIRTDSSSGSLEFPKDDSWFQTIQLRIQPNEKLTSNEQLIVEQTHNMPMGHALVRLPLAWVPFFLRSHQIATSAQQIQMTSVFQLQVRTEDWVDIKSLLKKESPWYQEGISE
jgi:predicted DNA-binding transcriptional regulator YafY